MYVCKQKNEQIILINLHDAPFLCAIFVLEELLT